jgi:hypothetical protein
MEVNSFFSWELLQTAAGIAAITWVFISFLKQVFGIYWTNVVNNVATYVVALGLIVVNNVMAGSDWPNYVLAVFNAAVVYGAVVQISKKNIPQLVLKLKKD